MSYLVMDENKHEYHQYSRNGRTVIVFKYLDDNSWGCQYFENQLVDGEHKKVFIAEESYKGHSESYAESAADNYVFGIKNFEENQT
jgi:hypothetical protein